MTADLGGLSAAVTFAEVTTAECEAPATAALMSAAKAGKDTFFGNRVCPFAQRTYWTMAERNAVDAYEYAHVDLTIGGNTMPEWCACHHLCNHHDARQPPPTLPPLTTPPIT